MPPVTRRITRCAAVGALLLSTSAFSALPGVTELGKTPEAKQILAFYTSSAAVGRSIVAPPGMPTDRVKVLRTAFDAMVKDPEFLAEIERAQQEFQPASGEELQKLIQDTAIVPAEIVERTGTILRSK